MKISPLITKLIRSQQINSINSINSINRIETIKNNKSVIVNSIRDRVLKFNKNFMGIACGDTGSGKSYCMLSLAEQLDPNFTINQVVFNTRDFMRLINNPAMGRGSVIIYDECGVGVPSREWFQQSNKLFNYVAQTFRNKNLIILFTTPHFKFLDSQVRILLHGYFQPFAINKREKYAKVKAYLLQSNPAMDKTYYHKFNTYNKGKGENVKISYAKIFMPSKNLVKAYEIKKTKFTNELNKNVMFGVQEEKQIIETKELTQFEINIKEALLLKGDKVTDLCIKYGRSKKSIYDIIKRISKKVGYDLLSSKKAKKKALNSNKT